MNLESQQFSFSIGAAWDINNALFPQFKEDVKPLYYSEDWKEDRFVTGRLLSFEWQFIAFNKPIFLEYYRGEFREQYSDPLMVWSEDEFDRIYNSIVVGSYISLGKDSKRLELKLNYGLNFNLIKSYLNSYSIIQDDNNNFVGIDAVPNHNSEFNLGFKSGLTLDYFSKNEKVALGIKLSTFIQLTKNQNFATCSLMPSVSYKL